MNVDPNTMHYRAAALIARGNATSLKAAGVILAQLHDSHALKLSGRLAKARKALASKPPVKRKTKAAS